MFKKGGYLALKVINYILPSTKTEKSIKLIQINPHENKIQVIEACFDAATFHNLFIECNGSKFKSQWNRSGH